VNATARFEADETYIVVVYGTFDDTDEYPVELAIYEGARESASEPGNVDILFFHGAPDAPTVDIATESTVLFDDVSYSEFSVDYISVPAATYPLTVQSANNVLTAATYRAQLEFWKNRSLVVFASGEASDNTFQTWTALSKGGGYPLPLLGENIQNQPTLQAAASTSLNTDDLLVLGVYPNPTTADISLKFMMNETGNLTIDLVDTQGRLLRTVFEGEQEKGAYDLVEQVDDLAKGVYFFRLQMNGQMVTKRFVKQ
jgi:hypothetical protein